MIDLVLRMVWTRRGQALTLVLLTLFGVTAAVAAPAYLRAVDRAVAAGQVATALPSETSVSILAQQTDTRHDPSGGGGIDLAGTGDALFGLPGFVYTYSAEFPSVGIDPDPSHRTRFVYRQRVCEHVTIVAGRCLSGESDVVLGQAFAQKFGVEAGDTVTLTHALLSTGPGDPPMYEPDGQPKKLLVAGLYTVDRPGDVFWGSHGYFNPEYGIPGAPAFVGSSTYSTIDKGAQEFGIDASAGPGALDVDRLPGVRSALAQLRGALAGISPGGAGELQLTTGVDTLLARIDAGRAAAHRIVPVLATALVLLSLLTIFLAVGYGTEGRRPELAVVALRGARAGQRWWLATGENLVAIVIGAVLGCVTGQLLVNVIAAVRFPGVGADPGFSSLRWAPVAAGAAVVTALIAERRQLVTPVSELLRRAPTAPHPARAIAAEIVVLLLAAAAVVQLKLAGGALSGVGTLAPGLVMLAAALLAGRILLPWMTALSRRALARGRLGPALAGYQLSRRPGAVRLFALLTATVAVASYAAGAIDVAARGRTVQAELGTGAPRVLTVSPIGRSALLADVARADPDGHFAMAAVHMPAATGQPPAVAVDTTRLAAVASWPAGGPDAASTARKLRPSPPATVTLTGATLAFDVESAGFASYNGVTVTALVSPAGSAGDTPVRLGVIQPGRHVYAVATPGCAAGCVLNSLQIEGGTGAVDVAGKLTFHRIGSAGLADASRWRVTQGGTVGPGPDGLLVTVTSLNGLPDGMWLQPVDTPLPMPAAIAGDWAGTSINGFDVREVPIDRVASVPAVPSLGSRAVLVDLAYAALLATDGSQNDAQVWLARDAPADAVSRLEKSGLVITGDVAASRIQAQLDSQGPALALWFSGMVAVLATLLAAGALVLAAAVDRNRRVEDLAALRWQGLTRRSLRTATLATYPVLVAVAVIAGSAIGLLGWWLTGWALPLAGIDPPALPLPGFPGPEVPLVTAVVVFAVLGGVSYWTGRRTLRRIK